MRDPNRLREQAGGCRTLTIIVIDPELVEQLRVWATEIADEADIVERKAAERERAIMPF